jgi:hypothetical protein
VGKKLAFLSCEKKTSGMVFALIFRPKVHPNQYHLDADKPLEA